MLSLITFSNQAQTREVKRAIETTDYRVEVMDGHSWLALEHRETHDHLLLLLGPDAESYPGIAEVLKVNHLTPNLVLFPNDVSNWDKNLIDHAYDFVGWPCSDNEISFRLNRSCQHDDRDLYPNDLDGFADLNLIGSSLKFLEILALVKRFARFEVPVLLEGETGTGKSLVAQAIHYLSARQAQPFIPVNCGAIPENLIENELFGHTRGAYTDARERQSGLISLAEGGTLFLDEINALPLQAQTVLLRFLEDGKYKPLGENRMLQSDIRIVSASNADLTEMISEGLFREDLYYRLNLARLELDPLRDRREDIPMLVNFFLHECQLAYELAPKSFHPESMHWLQQQEWRGNIREIKNFVHQQYLVTEGAVIIVNADTAANAEDPRDIIDKRILDPRKLTFNQAKALMVSEFERQYLTRVLREFDGNVTQAAKCAGKERRALGKLLKKHGITAAAIASPG